MKINWIIVLFSFGCFDAPTIVDVATNPTDVGVDSASRDAKSDTSVDMTPNDSSVDRPDVATDRGTGDSGSSDTTRDVPDLSGTFEPNNWQTRLPTLLLDGDLRVSTTGTASGGSGFRTIDAPQGNGFVTTNQVAPVIVPRTSMPHGTTAVMGGWFRFTNPNIQFVVARRDNPNNGQAIAITIAEGGQPVCIYANGQVEQMGFATNVGDGNWHHIVCRYASSGMEMFLDGVSVNAVSYNNVSLSLGSFDVVVGSSALPGFNMVPDVDVDEFFVATRELTRPEIYRIYSCGTDGKRCLCNAAAPTEYQTFGRALTTDWLPPCDATPAF